MRSIIAVLLLICSLGTSAQTEEQKLEATLKEFHQALVKKNTISINQQTDKAMTYGHSNGYVETKNELIKNLETGKIVYSSFKEDSISTSVNGTMASARFSAVIKGTMNGVANTYHLKVLEVWVKKGNRWILFARQATAKN